MIILSVQCELKPVSSLRADSALRRVVADFVLVAHPVHLQSSLLHRNRLAGQ